VVLAAVTITSLLAPSAARAADDTVFTFQGGGWGHSVGMSQYGAFGMSKEGYTHDQIIGHYYTDASVVDVLPSLVEENIWVNISTPGEFGSVSLEVVGIVPPSVPVVFDVGPIEYPAAVGDVVTITALGEGMCRFSGPPGSIDYWCMADIDWDGWEVQPTAGVQVKGVSGCNVGVPPTCRYARGALRIRPHSNPNQFNLTLEIDMEKYLLGLSEMPGLWGAPSNGGMEALRAQAVAGRSYAVRTVLDRGDPAGRPFCWCQLYRSTIDQAYTGWGFGSSYWIEAVQSTAGRVATHTSSSPGVPFKAFYSSSTYGATEKGSDGFGGTDNAWLQPVDDHWSADPGLNPNARWNRSYTGQTVADVLNNGHGLPFFSTVDEVEISECSTTGAALELRFSGGGAQADVSTRVLRGWFSNVEDVDGKEDWLSMQVFNVGAPPPETPPCPNQVAWESIPECNGIGYNGLDPTHWIFPGEFPVVGGTVVVDLTGEPGPAVVFWDGEYTGKVRIEGTPVGDVICGADNTGSGFDWIHGRGGPDVIFGGDGEDILSGGSGPDTIHAGDTGATLRGSRGDDTLYGGAGADLIRGGAGADELYGAGGQDVMRGNQGDDLIDGGGSPDWLAGGDGNDTLFAGSGNGDRLFGGAGDDTMYGGSGDEDILRGETGSDTMFGGSGHRHRLYGDEDEDTITGGAGDDHYLRGGQGADVLTAGTGANHTLVQN